MKQEIFHFIGMGGIGMSALARIAMQKGALVQGSDSSESQLLRQLQQEGASIYVGHKEEPVDRATAVIFSSAVKEENVELIRAKQRGVPLLHRSEFLGALMRDHHPLLVTGTHGKTTTTSLLAYVLFEAQMDPSFVVGGIHQNLQTNGRAGKGPYFVAEADESDGSFLKTPSFGAIVTNLNDDHLDYWKTSEQLNSSFAQFFSQVTHPEHLFWCGDEERLRSLRPKGISYGFGPHNQLRIERFRATDQGILFDVIWDRVRYEEIALSLHGKHNALNGAAVFGLALSLKVPEEAIRKAFLSFRGAQRRLEFKGSAHGVEVYDDYGHHPIEIAATLKAIRGKIREKRLVVLFQPHRYTRVRDLFERFAECFEEADLVLMTEIYSAGETPIEGITSEALFSKLKEKLEEKVLFFSRSGLESAVAAQLMPHDVLLTIGAGDVTKAGVPILDIYKERAPKWKVAVLFGGTSVEHEVSLMSANRILSSLDRSLYTIKSFHVDKEGRWSFGTEHSEGMISSSILRELTECDVAIPVFHGPQGEDGMFQGFLDALNIPYVGCDYRAGALCMHKGWTKHMAVMRGVPTAPYIEVDRSVRGELLERIEHRLSYPVWVKPVHLGSSIGVRRAANREEALEAAEIAFALDDMIIVEKEVRGIQVEYAILGNEFLRVAKSCEILNSGFHDYASKYGPTASGMAIPARISEIDEQIGAELALQMYRQTGCKGLARIDFFFDEEGHFWLNEINPFPGFTPTSAYPSMWEESGMSLSELCNQMIILAFQRHRRLAEIRGK